jgi:hypothetical protein
LGTIGATVLPRKERAPKERIQREPGRKGRKTGKEGKEGKREEDAVGLSTEKHHWMEEWGKGKHMRASNLKYLSPGGELGKEGQKRRRCAWVGVEDVGKWLPLGLSEPAELPVGGVMSL